MINDSILWTVSPLSCRVYMVKIAFDIGFFGVLTYWVDFIGSRQRLPINYRVLSRALL